MRHCEDCGTVLRGGYCTNCQEEAYIYYEQADPAERKTFSPDFVEKADQQLRDQKQGEERKNLFDN